jgi:hypothetical protein
MGGNYKARDEAAGTGAGALKAPGVLICCGTDILWASVLQNRDDIKRSI